MYREENINLYLKGLIEQLIKIEDEISRVRTASLFDELRKHMDNAIETKIREILDEGGGGNYIQGNRLRIN